MILIVDDNQENIFSLKTLLSIHHFNVQTARSGEEALKRILKEEYSLIILDVQMPDMDGFEVAEALAGYSKSKDIPIIFLSAINTTKRYITRGYESGAVDYVTKPFDPDILLLKVKNFYRLSEQNRQLNALEKMLREEIEWRKQAEVILEQKVAERTRELTYSNQLLEASNLDLQQFAYIASHDLQEPLRKIQTFANLARERFMDDKERMDTYLTKIAGSADRLRILIKDLLAYSKIYVDQKFVPTDLNAVVNQVVTEMKDNQEDKDLNATIHVDPLPVIEAIPSQIGQIFHNLISNALKFRKEGNVCTIRIAGEVVSEKSLIAPADTQGNFCRITVSDNGIGFNPAFKEKIFEIFQRLNGTHLYEGTGIGLAVVKKAVENHQGIISASSNENEGSVFTLVLPLHRNIVSESISSSFI